MYLLTPFILQNFLKIVRADPELCGCVIFRPKMAHFSRTKSFLNKPLLLLSSPYCSFSLCKIFKKFLQQIQSYEDTSFSRRKWFIHPKQFLFWKKLLMLFSATYWPLSLCKIFKKFLEPIQSYEAVPFFGQIYSNWSWEKCFSTDHYHYFHLPVGPFHWAKLKKEFLQWIQCYGNASFLGPKWFICPKNVIWKKLLRLFSSTYWLFLLCNFPKRNFFKKSFDKTSSYHSSLSTCQK